MNYTVKIGHRTTQSSPTTELGSVTVLVDFAGKCEATGELNPSAVRTAYGGMVPGRVASTFARMKSVAWVAEYLTDNRFTTFRDDATGLEGYIEQSKNS